MLKSISNKPISSRSVNDKESIELQQQIETFFDKENLKPKQIIYDEHFLPPISKNKTSTKRVKRSSSEVALNNLLTTDEQIETKLFKSKSTKSLFKKSSDNTKKVFLKNRNTIRLYDRVPSHSMPPLHITNQEEVKKNFFEFKIPPVLHFKADKKVIQNILTKHNKTSFEHFFKAKNILDHVKSKFSSGIFAYYEENFGEKVSSKDCVEIIGKYLSENRITGEITINFAPGLTCSGRIISYTNQKNKPETRKFVVWINDGEENQFLRKNGITCLCDHEIGTHYYRAYNDGNILKSF